MYDLPKFAKHAMAGTRRLRSRQSRHLTSRLRVISVGTYIRRPIATGNTRARPNFPRRDISHNKKSWWSRKKFSTLRIFRVPSTARCWWQTRRRPVQDSSTTRSKRSRVQGTRPRNARSDPDVFVDRRVLCWAPCATFEGTGRQTHACCHQACDLTRTRYTLGGRRVRVKSRDELRFPAKLVRSASSRPARFLAEISSGLTYKGTLARENLPAFARFKKVRSSALFSLTASICYRESTLFTSYSDSFWAQTRIFASVSSLDRVSLPLALPIFWSLFSFTRINKYKRQFSSIYTTDVLI